MQLYCKCWEMLSQGPSDVEKCKLFLSAGKLGSANEKDGEIKNLGGIKQTVADYFVIRGDGQPFPFPNSGHLLFTHNRN